MSERAACKRAAIKLLRPRSAQFKWNRKSAGDVIVDQAGYPMFDACGNGPASADRAAAIRSKNGREALSQVVGQARTYSWQEDQGVILVYENRLHCSPGNGLNVTLRRFEMPVNLSELKLLLPDAIGAKVSGLGGLPGGLALFQESSLPLHPRLFRNQEVRNILIAAYREAPNVFSVVLFPKNDPGRRNLETEPLGGWSLVAGADLQTFRFYVQSTSPHR